MLFRCSLASDEFNFTEFHNYVTLNFETEAKTLRPKPECLEAKTEAEATNHKTEAEVEAKLLALRPVWSGIEALTSLISIDETFGRAVRQCCSPA